MASGQIVYQVVSITFASVSLDMPTGWDLTEICTVLPVTYADNVWAQVCPTIGRSIEGMLSSLNISVEVAMETKGTLLIVLKEAGGSTATITVTLLKLINVHRAGQSPPYGKNKRLINEGVSTLGVAL